MSLLRLDSVSAGYDSKLVLNQLSLTLEPGELLGVLGANGCGKSTLIKIISGLVKLTSGKVYIEDRDIKTLKSEERARFLGVVPQNPTLPETFTTAEVVMFGRTPHLRLFQNESQEDWQIVEQAMRVTDCWHMADSYVGELSGGERQRVTLALALAQQPRVLLLDEPTTFLDINYQIEAMEIVNQWKQSGEDGKPRGVLGVFHELNLAVQYCDRLALVSKGSIIALGKPEEVITSENIYKAYGAHVLVAPHPVNNQPTTFFMPGRYPN